MKNNKRGIKKKFLYKYIKRLEFLKQFLQEKGNLMTLKLKTLTSNSRLMMAWQNWAWEKFVNRS